MNLPRKVRLSAPAKVNFFLHVLGKREDGYHDLCTWMQKIDLYDQIELTVAAGKGKGEVVFSCSDTSVPADDTNLAVRAAKAFLATSSCLGDCLVTISLEKNIPVAAGLGGGSSDAGTVLRGLNGIAGGELTEKQLLVLAKKLGADVPFFATSHSSVIAEGIGDIMYPVDSAENWSIILINPDFFVSTAWVFGNLSLTSREKNSKLPRFQKRNADFLTFDDMHNDLEKVSCARYPVIEKMKQSLLAVGARRVLMSGSGPTVFGIFPDTEKSIGADLQRIVGGLRQEYGDKVYLSRACTGASPSGKAPGFDPGIRRFESCRPSHH